MGSQAGSNLTTDDNNIDIANSGVAAESNTIRIGTVGTQTNTFIAGISGVTVPNAANPVFVDSVTQPFPPGEDTGGVGVKTKSTLVQLPRVSLAKGSATKMSL